MKPYKRGLVYTLLEPHQHALAKKKHQIHIHNKRSWGMYRRFNKAHQTLAYSNTERLLGL